MQRDQVTLRDIYDAIDRLDAKVGKRIDKVEADVNELQAFQNKSLGVLTIAMSFLTLAFNYFWGKLTRAE